MRLDHLSYAAGPDGLDSTAERLGQALGLEFADGGVHPRFGTQNRNARSHPVPAGSTTKALSCP